MIYFIEKVMPHAPNSDNSLINKDIIMGHEKKSHAPFLPLMPHYKARLEFFLKKPEK